MVAFGREAKLLVIAEDIPNQAPYVASFLILDGATSVAAVDCLV